MIDGQRVCKPLELSTGNHWFVIEGTDVKDGDDARASRNHVRLRRVSVAPALTRSSGLPAIPAKCIRSSMWSARDGVQSELFRQHATTSHRNISKSCAPYENDEQGEIQE